jgi:hypothetical protein
VLLFANDRDSVQVTGRSQNVGKIQVVSSQVSTKAKVFTATLLSSC